MVVVVEVSVIEVDVVFVVAELLLALTVYKLSPLLPPHISAELAAQAILHRPSVAIVDNDDNVLPQ